jgi:hypothetical protein
VQKAPERGGHACLLNLAETSVFLKFNFLKRIYILVKLLGSSVYYGCPIPEEKRMTTMDAKNERNIMKNVGRINAQNEPIPN